MWDYSLTTRPINDLLGKITAREEELKAKGIIPEVVVCGAGAAGTELSFGFKHRWTKYFGKEIKVTLVSSKATILDGATESTLAQTYRKLKEHNIEVIHEKRIDSIHPDAVHLNDGQKLKCDVAVWATGAEPQKVSMDSDLQLMKGYFQVNDHMQSVSHPNIFAGGDCVTMETYADQVNFPPKAGVYAVRAGPVIAENVVNFLEKKPLGTYVPQKGFLSLMMTGDGNCIGAKHGITFVGKWVWGLKDYIDMGFMNLFNPKYLFKDYATKGTAEPIDNDELFDSQKSDLDAQLAPMRERVKVMTPEEAAKMLACGENETEFHERWILLQRMHTDAEYTAQVVSHFKPDYYL